MTRGAGAGRAAGAQARRGRAQQECRACLGARMGTAGGWARGRGAQRARGLAEQAARRRWGVGVHSGRGRQARTRQVSGSRRGSARSSRGMAGWAAGARPRRWARSLGAGPAALARELALGCALGALGLFSIRFDSVFFLSHQMNTVHCKIKFSKKKIIFSKI